MRSGSQPVPVGLSGEAVARQGWDHDIESVLGAASVRGRVRERTDDLELLNDGSGPAVRDDDRERIRMTRTDVDEVNVHVIDRCHELRQGIELGLGFTPVVVRSPIPHQFLEFCELHALRLVIDRLPIRPSRGNDAPAEIDELIFRNVDAERADCAVFGCGSRMPGKQAQGSRSSNTDEQRLRQTGGDHGRYLPIPWQSSFIQRSDYLPPTTSIFTMRGAATKAKFTFACFTTPNFYAALNADVLVILCPSIFCPQSSRISVTSFLGHWRTFPCARTLPAQSGHQYQTE